MDPDQNRAVWNRSYDWSHAGDEWSEAWGGPDMQWFGTLLPRVQALVPAKHVLEIAPGHGRWTKYLLGHAQTAYLGVDISQRCVAYCRQRFADAEHAQFHVNDGASVAMVQDGWADLVFSFDSLVHVDGAQLRGYIHEMARVLAPDGVAFLHHSNLGRYAPLARLSRQAPGRVRRRLAPRGLLIDVDAARAEDVSGADVCRWCGESGLAVSSQEYLGWTSGPRLVDCISVVTRPGSRHARPLQTLSNPRFMEEARRLKRLAALYTPLRP